MSNNSKNYLNNILQKTFVLIILDIICILFATFVGFWLIDDYSLISNRDIFLNLTIFLTILGPIFSFISGQYKSFSKYYSSPVYYQYSLQNFLIFIILIILARLFSIKLLPIKSLFLVWIILTGFTLFARIILRDIIKQVKTNSKRKQIVIYGAGDAGIQLYASLKISGEFKVLSFVDDSKNLINRKINNVPINSPNYLRKNKEIIDQVLLAIPSASFKRRSEILNNIKSLGLSCMQTPSLEDITSGRAKINSLKPILIENLLGRVKVEPQIDLLKKAINSETICITGAGGSIGSELCKQILLFNPKRLVLIDMSEPSLYQLKLKVNEEKRKKNEIIYLLGDVSNNSFLEKVLK